MNAPRDTSLERIDYGEAVMSLTVRESHLIVKTLKADWLENHPSHAQKDYIEALRRFEILTGL